MDPRIPVTEYYRAWQQRAGDMTDVPLAEDFSFSGPVASFTDADGYRAMARQAGAAVREFTVRHQFVDGDLVCSIVDWRMDPLPGTLTAAELLRVRDGRIVSGELIYDAEDLRRAMAGPPDPLILLRRAYATTEQVLASVPPGGWTAQSACAKWTVRQAANHLLGGLLLIARIAEGESPDPAELDAQVQADIDHLGDDPADAFRRVAGRSVAVFARPGILAAEFPFMGGTAPGATFVSISLLEALVHGWDIAVGAGLPYPADEEVALATWEFTHDGAMDERRKPGRFADPVPVDPAASLMTRLLGHLGRQATP